MDDQKIDHIVGVFPSFSNLSAQDWELAETIPCGKNQCQPNK